MVVASSQTEFQAHTTTPKGWPALKSELGTKITSRQSGIPPNWTGGESLKTQHERVTTNFHSGCIVCKGPDPKRATLFGNSAEWVVETTFYGTKKDPLPNTGWLAEFGE